MWILAQIDIPTPTPMPISTPEYTFSGIPSGGAIAQQLSYNAVAYWQTYFAPEFVVSFQLAILLMLILGGIVMIARQLDS